MSHIGVVPEILRGIRTHFDKLVKGLTEKKSSKAQLGLGHAYSRAKVKFNVNKSDNMIIQVCCNVNQTFGMGFTHLISSHIGQSSDNWLVFLFLEHSIA